MNQKIGILHTHKWERLNDTMLFCACGEFRMPPPSPQLTPNVYGPPYVLPHTCAPCTRPHTDDNRSITWVYEPIKYTDTHFFGGAPWED